ncbi:MAG TPA: hypothetical protein VFM05_13970 [Candidatus Saccharimonadales bacterium]|nr:hypothetical protein [Candidatus Saccharimonadales bacterium]
MRLQRDQSGQVLVMLLAFMATAIILTTSAVAVVIANMQAGTKQIKGEKALQVAESGADNALMRLLRDPSYAGETLTIADGTATITLSGSPTVTIVSKGQVGDFRRTIQVTAARLNNTLVVSSWKEVP